MCKNFELMGGVLLLGIKVQRLKSSELWNPPLMNSLFTEKVVEYLDFHWYLSGLRKEPGERETHTVMGRRCKFCTDNTGGPHVDQNFFMF